MSNVKAYLEQVHTHAHSSQRYRYAKLKTERIFLDTNTPFFFQRINKDGSK